MTIAEIGIALTLSAGTAAGYGARQETAKPRHPIADMTPQQREEFWANEGRKLRERLLNSSPTFGEDPIDGVLRKMYRGDYNQRSWEE